MANSAEVEKLHPWVTQYKQMEKGIRKKLATAEKNADDYVSAVSTLLEALAANNARPEQTAAMRAAYISFQKTFKALMPKEVRTTSFHSAAAEMYEAIKKEQLGLLENQRAAIDGVIIEWLGDSVRRYKWIAPIHIQLRKIANSASTILEALKNSVTYRDRFAMHATDWLNQWRDFWAMIDNLIDDPCTLDMKIPSRAASGRLRHRVP